ncbi:hypothetical protein PoB_006068400 [Plakobranchus ocellatus]|uniref:Uncharacterized protein n=1 Tax=Plakobranchus ocellatus TaxID=259542 RepID=A0AAV4CQN5_9GAST|nr:hypothetical protein PoB_006068400 [Plakobranchus ocellatus]
MASYWKSPYKKETHPDTFYSSFSTDKPGSDSFIPFAAWPYCGLGKARQAGPVSSQEWFDWALAVSTNSFRPAASNSRQQIKGILKIPTDESANEDERTGQDTESNESARSETTLSKREKKRVTFGETSGSEASYSGKYHPSRFILPFNSISKMKYGLSLSKLPKQSSSRQKEVTKERPKFPAVEDAGEKASPKNSSICKHSPDLRCASCVSSANTEKILSLCEPSQKDQEERQSLQENVEKTPQVQVSWPDSTQPIEASYPQTQHINETYKVLESSREPLKKYKPQWTNTLVRLPRKKKSVRLSYRRNNLLLNSLAQKCDAVKEKACNESLKNQVSDDFLKLHIRGDGKMVGVKLHDQDEVLRGRQKAPPVLATSKSTPITPSKRNGCSFASSIQSSKQNIPLTRGKSAPCRLGEPVNNSRAETCMDKTSQILSWLNDVRSKSQFKPRNARLYAADSSLLRRQQNS